MRFLWQANLVDELENALHEMCAEMDLLQAEVGTVEGVQPSRTGPTGPSEFAPNANGAGGEPAAKSSASGIYTDSVVRTVTPGAALPPPQGTPFTVWAVGMPVPGEGYLRPNDGPMPATGRVPADPSQGFGAIEPSSLGLEAYIALPADAFREWTNGTLSMDGLEAELVNAAGQGDKPTTVALDDGTRAFSAGIEALWRAASEQSASIMPSRTGGQGAQVGGVELMPSDNSASAAVAKSGQFGVVNTAMAQGTSAPLTQPGYGPIGELLTGPAPNASVPMPAPQISMSPLQGMPQWGSPSSGLMQSVIELATGWRAMPERAINGGVAATDLAWREPMAKSVKSLPMKTCKACKSYHATKGNLCQGCAG